MSLDSPHDDSVTKILDPVARLAGARVGTTLRGKWRLDVLLGVGGMAAIYAATHRNETRAAIKILHASLALEPAIRARFLKEGRVANLVGHPGAVRVLDDDVTDEGAVYLVMELLDGESLESRAARLGGVLPGEEVLGATDQLLDVLAAAHDRGIVHRDLKPENLFLTREGQLKVLDFGIARLRELSTSSSATRAGSILGTPAYMAPEQARGRWDDVDARTDLWAVGATMFRLLTGRHVHAGETVNETLALSITQPATPILGVDPSIPQPVADLVDRALAFDRDARWTDARSMQFELRLAYESAHSGSPISSAPRLWVPATVPDRTLPSAGVAVGSDGPELATEAPVANGISGQALLRSMSRHPGAVVAVAASVAVVVIVGLVVTASLGERDPSGAIATSAHAATVPANAASPPPAVQSRPTPALPAPPAQSAVLSVEQLPTATTKAAREAAPPPRAGNPYAVAQPRPGAAQPKASASQPKATTPALKPISPPKPQPRAGGGLAEDPE